MTGGIVLVLLSSGAGLALPALAGDVVGASTSTEALSSLVLLLVGLLLAQIFLNASGRYLLAHGGETTVLRLRQTLLHRALYVQIQAAHEVRVGDFISRVSADTTLLRDALSRGFVEMLISVPFIIGASILMARLDTSLFLVVGATIAATMAAATVFIGKVRDASIVSQSEMGNLSADVERALSATRTIKIAQAEAAEQDRLSRSARNAWHAGIRTARVISAASPMVQLAGSGALFAALIIGAAKVGQGSLELGSLISFMLYTLYLLTPLNSILEGVSSIRQAEGALQRINETLEIPVENASGNVENSPRLYADVDAPALVLDSVSFSYPDRPAVLNGVDLVIERGGRAAIVGPSGAGKSTLLALICNFYQPSRGRVLVGGHDVSDVQQDVRQLIGLVEQESAMLAGTVRENLLMTRPDADMADLFEVLRIVGMADAVSRLPQGVDSDIGEHGQLLSGGQRQRLAIARALLGKPSLLLLDEPTSNLDEYNEQTVLDAIDSLPDDQTVLLISHRESTLRVARQVVLIDEAGVSEEGRAK